MRGRTSFLAILSLDPRVAMFMNLTIPDSEFFIQEIDAIDNAACTWITLMSGLNFDVFQGFESEGELVDFFLTKQYHMNVSAVAGMSVSYVYPLPYLGRHFDGVPFIFLHYVWIN